MLRRAAGSAPAYRADRKAGQLPLVAPHSCDTTALLPDPAAWHLTFMVSSGYTSAICCSLKGQVVVVRVGWWETNETIPCERFGGGVSMRCNMFQ